MKKKLTSNLVLKILSIIMAFIFWIIVVNLTDPTTTRTFTGIPVKVLNENVITSSNQVYEIVDGETVDVTIKGKRSVVEKISKNDFEATADMSELSKVNAVSIHVEIKKQVNAPNIEMDWGNSMMKISLEERVTSKFQVKVEHQGKLHDRYVLGEISAQPNIIEVSCGKSKFKRIDHVGVVVSLDGESSDFAREYSPTLYDANGERINNDNVTFSSDGITVTTRVLAIKEIPVYVFTTGEPAKGYHLVQTDFQPDMIRVAGTKKDLAKISSIKVPVSIRGMRTDVEEEIPILNYLPNGVEIVGDTNTISVHCEIEKNGMRSFVISSKDIAVKNLPSNCTIEYEDEDLKYNVILNGKDEDLKGISVSNLGAFIDLTGFGAGQYTLDVQFGVPDTVKLKKAINVTVIIHNPDSQGATAPHVPTGTDSPQKSEGTEQIEESEKVEETEETEQTEK